MLFLYIVSELVPAVDTVGYKLVSWNFLAAFVLELATNKKSVANAFVFESVDNDVISAIVFLFYYSSPKETPLLVNDDPPIVKSSDTSVFCCVSCK